VTKLEYSSVLLNLVAAGLVAPDAGWLGCRVSGLNDILTVIIAVGGVRVESCRFLGIIGC
jgi:hypothetical protein